MDTKTRLLIIDDDEKLVDTYKDFLSIREGYNIDVGYDGKTLRQRYPSQHYDLILLDFILPDENGLRLLQYVKEINPQQLVLMFSSAAEDSERIVALENGADNYLRKPISSSEIAAYIRHALKNSQRTGQEASETHVLQFGPYRLDKLGRKLFRNDELVHLPPRIFELLLYFCERPHEVVSRQQLMSAMQSSEQSRAERKTDSRLVDVRVKRLREKIEPNSEQPVYIRTIWGTGYMFEPHGGNGVGKPPNNKQTKRVAATQVQ